MTGAPALRVLMNAGPWLPVPPAGYGGIENVVATLIPALRDRGVHVTLATVGDPGIEVDDVVAPLESPRFDRIARPYNQVSGIAHAHMAGVVDAIRSGGFDLVHDHLEVVGSSVLAAMGQACPPVLQTLHWDLAKHADFYTRFEGCGRVAFAAVSQSQLDRAPENLARQTLGVVPLSSPEPEPMQVEPGEHALVLARITRDKGQDTAIRICREAGIPLVLAGPVAGIGDPEELNRRLDAGEEGLAEHPDAAYYAAEVRPLLGEDARWIGGVEGIEKERLLRSARVLLAPNRWAEPGATGVVEAMLRGIPVVATRFGVLPSLVRDGETGHLADTHEELVAALGRLDEISPEACRRAAEGFTPGVMADRYLDLYDRLLRRNA